MISPCDSCQFLFNQKRKPYTMKCQHNFCTKCLLKQHKQIDMNSTQSTITNKQIICPRCKENSLPFYDPVLYQTILQRNRYKDVDRIIKICFFGQVSVGKTSLINRLAKDKFFIESIPTIGMGFSSTKKVIQLNTIFYHFIDTAGTENYRSLFPSQFRDADIAFIVFDVNKSIQENKLRYWVSQIQEKCNTTKILLLGNKIDLLHDFETNQPMKYAESVRQQKNWNNFCISCKENIGIGQIWKILNKLALECQFGTKSKSVILAPASKQQQKIRQQNQKKTCC